MTVLIALVVGVFVVLALRAVRETIALARMRPGTAREHDMSRVASYFAAIDPPVRAPPERAWADLDLDDVFRTLDRTAGWPGQHLLYARLRREDHSAEALLAFHPRARSAEPAESAHDRRLKRRKPDQILLAGLRLSVTATMTR
jgi:hypothetical protein